MSPDTLTVVAVVLAYDFARDRCDASGGRSLFPLLRLKSRSETRLENDMMADEMRCEERMDSGDERSVEEKGYTRMSRRCVEEEYYGVYSY